MTSVPPPRQYRFKNGYVITSNYENNRVTTFWNGRCMGNRTCTSPEHVDSLIDDLLIQVQRAAAPRPLNELLANQGANDDVQ